MQLNNLHLSSAQNVNCMSWFAINVVFNVLIHFEIHLYVTLHTSMHLHWRLNISEINWNADSHECKIRINLIKSLNSIRNSTVAIHFFFFNSIFNWWIDFSNEFERVVLCVSSDAPFRVLQCLRYFFGETEKSIDGHKTIDN